MIFDIKMDGDFTRKSRLVAGGHTTETPASLTYSSVVLRESVRVAFLLAALKTSLQLTSGMHTSMLHVWRRFVVELAKSLAATKVAS